MRGGDRPILLLRAQRISVRLPLLTREVLAVDKVQGQAEFKVGDNVRFTVTGTPVTVLGVERFRAPGQMRIIYKIKLPDRTVRAARPSELEPLEESNPAS